MSSSYKKYLYTATFERDIYIIELNPIACAWARPLYPSNMILLASGSRKLYSLDETTRKIHAYILGCGMFK
jgi:hypothetical protein